MAPIQTTIETTNLPKLSDRALLSDLTIGQWTARKKDRAKTLEVEADEGAINGSCSLWTQLINDATLKKIQSIVGKARITHRKLTLPWAESGPRILPGTMIEEYTTAMNKVKDDLDAAVAPFIAEYPMLVSKAANDLKGLFHAENYPSASEVRRKFRWKLQFLPIPEASDFRCKLNDDITAGIKANIEEQANEALAGITRDLWQRLYERVNHLADALSRTKKRSQLHKSVINQVVDLCGLLPKLNITGDKALNDMREEVTARLTGWSADDLRKNKAQRSKTAAVAKDLADRIAAHLPVE